MRLWGGRFSEGNDQRVADFTRSIEVDAGLAADDLAASIAHVRGLGRADAGGTRVIHAATFEPFDRWTGMLVRMGRASLASRVEAHLRGLKERAEDRTSSSHSAA